MSLGKKQQQTCIDTSLHICRGPRCFIEQDALPLLLSTGWFQERIRA